MRDTLVSVFGLQVQPVFAFGLQPSTFTTPINIQSGTQQVDRSCAKLALHVDGVSSCIGGFETVPLEVWGRGRDAITTCRAQKAL